MNYTTITAAIRRIGGRLWARYCTRTAGMLMILCAAVTGFPGLAKAEDSGCRASSGINIQLIPSVNFNISKIPPIGTEIYRTQTYVINYECFSYDRFGVQPREGVVQLQALGGYTTLNQSLNRAGLKLEIIVNGDFDRPWEPNIDPLSGTLDEWHAVGSAYSGSSGPRVLNLIAVLKVKNDNPRPARYPVPSSTIFKLVPFFGGGGYPGSFITTTATRMQFTPQCIGDVSVDNLVQFNRVIATADYMGTLPQQRSFNVTARINPSCDIGLLTAPADPDNDNTRFLMLLSAQFILQGPGSIDSDGTSIILRNEDGEENGLKMQILDPNNLSQPVRILPAAVPTSRDDVGNFGSLKGSNPVAAVHTYTASLTPDAGKELKFGKYSTQVLVKISYY
ncbi:hypothetical protein AH782_13055 [Salmonella enterica subsp. enterica]|nr:hypothetical protein [Salmonella enterica subsp. enterica serovar Rubislaw]EDK1586151.1 hypothetical protein [Salmonella enterica subsp. enterica serovar Rubislaw]